MSGGGGWGLKQGLLSLDPETSVSPETEANFDFDTFDPSGGYPGGPLADIAEPNSWIQFFTSPQSSHIEADTDMGMDVLDSVTFGCAPSTIDKLPESTMTAAAVGDTRPAIHGFQGQFGALSEAGIFVRGLNSGRLGSFKIDVPYSRLGWSKRR